MRYDAKVDGNHAEIRSAVRDAGYEWVDTFRLGRGFPDALVVSKSRLVALFEIKQKGEQLTPKEWQFYDWYTGYIYIIYSSEQALEFLAWLDGARVELPVRSEA